jgi:hypothetical protein
MDFALLILGLINPSFINMTKIFAPVRSFMYEILDSLIVHMWKRWFN